MPEILDAELDESKWPLAAFFMPNNNLEPSGFREFSEKFFSEYSHLLPEYVGVISQVGQPGDVAYDLRSPFDTLIFDARLRGVYLWQHTLADRGSRTIRQLKSTSRYLIGRHYDLDNQGVLVNSEALDTEAIKEASKNIWALLQSQQTRDYIEEVARTRDKAIASLEDFAVHRTKQVEHVAVGQNKLSSLQVITAELGGADYEKEYEKRRQIVEQIGFTALRPYEPGQV